MTAAVRETDVSGTSADRPTGAGESRVRTRPGIPTSADVSAVVAGETFARHARANKAFLSRHGPALQGYGRHWGSDPLRLWSRRWEYPFVASAVERHLEDASTAATIVDAGSGVTYFPYLLADRLPHARIVCVDNDPSYPPMFAAINANVRADAGDGAGERVRFHLAPLQRMPLADTSVDAVCCVSVLEHVFEYVARSPGGTETAHRDVLAEFRRVLKPGGLLVITFDLSLDGKFTLTHGQATALLNDLSADFDTGDFDSHRELAKMRDPALHGLLTTDAVATTDPELLPWRYRPLIAARDLWRGHGWTGGFRSKSVFCLEARRRG